MQDQFVPEVVLPTDWPQSSTPAASVERLLLSSSPHRPALRLGKGRVRLKTKTGRDKRTDLTMYGLRCARSGDLAYYKRCGAATQQRARKRFRVTLRRMLEALQTCERVPILDGRVLHCETEAQYHANQWWLKINCMVDIALNLDTLCGTRTFAVGRVNAF